MPNTETPAASRNTEEQLVMQAREFLRGVEYALCLVREADTCGVSAVLAKCPESYRRGQQDAIRAITTYLYPHARPHGGQEKGLHETETR